MGLDKIEEPPKIITPAPVNLPKSKKPKAQPKESFVSWLQKHKEELETEFPEMDANQRMKLAYSRFKEDITSKTSNKDTNEDNNKKRKLSDEQANENNQPKRSTSNKLAAFSRD